RRVMLYFCNLAASREQIVEVTFPERWIFSGPIPARLRPIENGLDSSSYSRCGFRLRGPDWLDDLQNQCDGDRMNGEWSEDRTDIGPDCRLPLRNVLLVFPSAGVRLYERIRALVECHGAGIFSSPLQTLSIACGYGIDTVCEQSSAFRSLQTRCGQAD